MSKKESKDIDKMHLEFAYKSFEDGVGMLKVIDTKIQLLLAFIGITIFPLSKFYMEIDTTDVCVIDYIILLTLIASIVTLLITLRERFDGCVNLTENTKLKMFFPKKFEKNIPIEKLVDKYFVDMKKMKKEDCLKNILFERLKFQKVLEVIYMQKWLL